MTEIDCIIISTHLQIINFDYFFFKKTGLRFVSVDVVEPLVLGCHTKNTKVVAVCLSGIQRLISHEALSEVASVNVIKALWVLMEVGIEELKLLQTAILLITTNDVVKHDALAKVR